MILDILMLGIKCNNVQDCHKVLLIRNDDQVFAELYPIKSTFTDSDGVFVHLFCARTMVGTRHIAIKKTMHTSMISSLKVKIMVWNSDSSFSFADIQCLANEILFTSGLLLDTNLQEFGHGAFLFAQRSDHSRRDGLKSITVNLQETKKRIQQELSTLVRNRVRHKQIMNSSCDFEHALSSTITPCLI